MDEIYLDLGDQLSAASVAAVRGERLPVGAIYDARFPDCRMRESAPPGCVPAGPARRPTRRRPEIENRGRKA